MSNALRLAAAIPLAAVTMARAHEEPAKRPPVQGRNCPPGRPRNIYRLRPDTPGRCGRPFTRQHHMALGSHAIHALGERGYGFRGPGGVCREIATFGPREREILVRRLGPDILAAGLNAPAPAVAAAVVVAPHRSWSYVRRRRS